MDSSMKVLFVTSEMYPYSEMSELSSFSYNFTMQLAKLGVDIRVVMPKYNINELFQNIDYYLDFTIDLDWRKQTAILREKKSDVGIKLYFIDNAYYFHRDQLYSYGDDNERFAFFSKAVLEMLENIEFKPDIIHINDWQTSITSLLFSEFYSKKDYYKDIKTVLTIHNIKNQGNFSKDTLSLLSLDDSYFSSEKLEFYGNVNYLKSGIIYSDIVTTVSEEYCEELKKPEFGHGLDGILRKKSDNFYGIINGIDYSLYNPYNDESIYCNYDISTIEDKKNNKYSLLDEFALNKEDVPLIGMISRLSDQKGFDLIEESIEEILNMDVKLIILGIGSPVYQDFLTNIKKRYSDKLAINFLYDDNFARKMFAACDFLLMPSKKQINASTLLKSFRYGTVPIGRKTGSLADLIVEKDNYKNGFLFYEYSSNEMVKAIKRAIKSYYEEHYKKIIYNCMESSYSWEYTAKKYMEIYKKI